MLNPPPCPHYTPNFPYNRAYPDSDDDHKTPSEVNPKIFGFDVDTTVWIGNNREKWFEKDSLGNWQYESKYERPLLRFC